MGVLLLEAAAERPVGARPVVSMSAMVSVVVISKDEPELAETLRVLRGESLSMSQSVEVIVVDASQGRLDSVKTEFSQVRWIPFESPAGVTVSIPHQRNVGIANATGEVIVFTDAGCRPRAGWLGMLTAPVLAGEESVTAGLAVAPPGVRDHYALAVNSRRHAEYVDEAPTINLAFTRAAFTAVGGFDEAFEYGSDLDFTWRLVDAGFRIRMVPDAVVEHSWGTARRQLRRAYRYGRAKARLYRKHRGRRSRIWRHDPLVVVYPAFLLGVPLTLALPAYPLLLLIPAWRARGAGPLMVVADHLAFGLGVLSTLIAG